ncbi:MAG: C39 family peptidase [Candidatus Eremiobacteraeota bacterium]|nr:C39 family peptidase [Candidatus Eremiobacteraeota bacterium]
MAVGDGPFVLAQDKRSLTVRGASFEDATLYCEPAREAIISWNTRMPSGELYVQLLRAHQPDGSWLPHAHWSASGRHSFSAKDGDTVIETDVLRTQQPFDGVRVHAKGVEFDRIALATPARNGASTKSNEPAIALDVPLRSQYVNDERGWCSPASLSMVHAYFGHDYDVATTARSVFDYAYNGTGNWAFNVAFSGELGLQGVVAYLSSLEHARSFLEQRIPLILSYSWRRGELPGAPLEHSDGHIVVLRGFDAQGDCLVNDPAQHEIRVTYPREALEHIWLRNKGVCYIVAPPEVALESFF